MPDPRIFVNRYGFQRGDRAEGKKMIVPDVKIADEIRDIGIRKTMVSLTGRSQHTIEKLVLGKKCDEKTHEYVLKIIRAHKSKIDQS